jgi:hypothetical protein
MLVSLFLSLCLYKYTIYIYNYIIYILPWSGWDWLRLNLWMSWWILVVLCNPVVYVALIMNEDLLLKVINHSLYTWVGLTVPNPPVNPTWSESTCFCVKTEQIPEHYWNLYLSSSWIWRSKGWIHQLKGQLYNVVPSDVCWFSFTTWTV